LNSSEPFPNTIDPSTFRLIQSIGEKEMMNDTARTQNTAELTRQHYDAVEDDQSLMAKVIQLLDAQIDGPVDVMQLAGLDQFHVRGLAATEELAKLVNIQREMKILDAGSGLGGPARYLAETYGCNVTGVDLTPSFVAVSKLLAERTGMSNLVSYKIGDLAALSFPDANFDVVWTQHVVMNIRDREQVYREFRRVLKPSGKLAFYDVFAADDKPEPLFPVPWAESSETSFLLTKAETIAAFERVDLTLSVWNDVTAAASAWIDQPKPPSPQGLSLATVMGPRFADMSANLVRNIREGRIRLVMGSCDATSARS